MAELVDIHFEDGRPITELDGLLQARMKWLGDTAERGLVAAAVNTLVSLRATTKLARATKKDFTLEQDDTFFPSFFAKRPCIRDKAGKHHIPNVKIYVTVPSCLFKNSFVYKMTFTHGGKEAYIIAMSEKAAEKKARAIVDKHIRRHAGLARLAWSALMMKTGQGGILGGGESIQSISLSETRTQETRTADGYRLTLFDNLRYAVPALKGGQADIELALQKAMNKTTATINRAIPTGKTWFGRWKIPSPFPEIRKRG